MVCSTELRAYPEAVSSGDDAFHELVSGLDYPMFIVTVAAGSERSGCLVGFVTQASIRPPRLMVMLSKANHTYRVAQRAACLGVHFLHAENQALATLFGEQTGDNVDKFSSCDWSAGPGQVPLLAGTRGWVIGTILARHDAGDHVAHLVDVAQASTSVPGPQLAFQTVTEMRPGHLS